MSTTAPTSTPPPATPPPAPSRPRPGASAPAPLDRARTGALTAQILVVLDISVVNTALPTIGRSLHLASSDLQWMVTAYLLMSGGGLLLGGRIADLLPRHRVFMTGHVRVHGRLAGQRVRLQRKRDRPCPRRTGSGRRADDTRRAVPDHDHLLRRTARQGARAVGCRRWTRHRRRRGGGRRPHHLGGLAVHLLGQRPHRGHRPGRRDQGPAPAPARPRPRSPGSTSPAPRLPSADWPR